MRPSTVRAGDLVIVPRPPALALSVLMSFLAGIGLAVVASLVYASHAGLVVCK